MDCGGKKTYYDTLLKRENVFFELYMHMYTHIHNFQNLQVSKYLLHSQNSLCGDR